MVVDDPKKDSKKRKEISGKLGKEIHDRRDECVVFTVARAPTLTQHSGRHYNETVNVLQRMALQLSTRPETLPLYELRLLALSLERSALLVQLELEEKHALDCAHQAYEEECQRVEDEWRRGRDRVRERLLEGIEERRRRAREEKGRRHRRRRLHGAVAPAHHAQAAEQDGHVAPAYAPRRAWHGSRARRGVISNQPITSGPQRGCRERGAGTNGRRRPKGSSTHLSQAIGGLGKSLAALTGCKESEIENDLVEIRRANKRRRAAQGNAVGQPVRRVRVGTGWSTETVGIGRSGGITARVSHRRDGLSAPWRTEPEPEGRERRATPSYRSVLLGFGAGSASILSHLRALLTENKLDAYVVPNEDEHGSEIPATSELRRGFMTGFHGTAGLAVVTQNEALLFVDSRYWIAAEKAMDPSLWQLRKVDPRAKVEGGFEDFLCSASLDIGLPAGSQLVCQLENLVDQVWTSKPPRSTDPVNVHPLKFTGKSWLGRGADSKIAELRETVVSYSSTASYLVTPLDDLAWILNLRGNDMFNQPFFYAYFFVSATDAILFIDSRKVAAETKDYLTGLGVKTQEYGTVWDFLKAEAQRDPKSAVLVDPKASYAVIQALESKATVIASPINGAKAIKNDTELQGFLMATCVRWYGWLEEQIVRKNARVTEYQAERKLNEYRSMEKYWAGDGSFISAYGPSAALPHYEAEEDDCLVIGRDAPYLIDSGQQYLDCTIDTTRTVHFGTPTKEHKRAFTRVLQAHIAVDALIFPAGTTGTTLDGIVRHHLWKDGMNFGHGPGHGIGSYGVVHESSTGISVPFVFKPGHVVTNEPGFYDEGKFGCRLESTIVVVKKTTRREFGGDIWMGFDRCTMVPIQTRLVDFSLLTKEETAWLEAHNKLCLRKLRPLLKDVGDKRALALFRSFF
ncbi:hypothetical protein B0H10DRAFT_1953894 [Mycena sp. CBHHK59/15]|nr:hypothetical protein B0H10DRAFT_1953894 [Mycena sp. CBHHK59/15]